MLKATPAYLDVCKLQDFVRPKVCDSSPDALRYRSGCSIRFWCGGFEHPCSWSGRCCMVNRGIHLDQLFVLLCLAFPAWLCGVAGGNLMAFGFEGNETCFERYWTYLILDASSDLDFIISIYDQKTLLVG